MKKEEIKQQLKNTALNKIRKIYNERLASHERGLTSNTWDEDNWAEQRDSMLEYIIKDLEKELKKVE